MPSPRRVLVFLLGYVAAVASAVTALALYVSAHLHFEESGRPLPPAWTIAEFGSVVAHIVALLLWICLPVAWIPLAVGLALWCHAVGGHRLLGCILVGTITGVASLVWIVAVVGGDGSQAINKATVAQLPYAASAGAVGGLVFWAIALRRARPDTHP